MKRIIATFCGLASLALLLAPTAEGKILRSRTQDRGFPGGNGGWCPLDPLDAGGFLRFQADGPSAVLSFAPNAQPGQRIADVFVVEESEYENEHNQEDDSFCGLGKVFNLASGTAVVDSLASEAHGWSLVGAGFSAGLAGPNGGGSLALNPGGKASITFTGLQKGKTYVVGCFWFTKGDGNVLSLSVDTLDSLDLSDGRFKVEATWRTPQGKAGVGQAVPLTGDTGYFWFFDPANVEVTVKVIDACLLNHRYWVFASGLTNVRVDLRITDTVSGKTKTYTNPPGTSFLPIQDTGAFATCP
jgi:hypothetical protein